jgi:hypothetical protein
VKNLALAIILVLAATGEMRASVVIFASLNSPDSLASLSVSGDTQTITYTGTQQFNFVAQPPSVQGIVESDLPVPLQDNNSVDATVTETFTSTSSGTQTNVDGVLIDAIPDWYGSITVTLTAAQVAALCGAYSLPATCIDGQSNPTLLQATFSTGSNALVFQANTGTASLNIDGPPVNVTFTSSLLTFPLPQIEDDITLNIAAPQGVLTLSGGTSGTLCEATSSPSTTCGGTHLNVQGTFQSNPVPTLVPEPGSLTLMLIGSGLVGLASLRLKRTRP